MTQSAMNSMSRREAVVLLLLAICFYPQASYASSPETVKLKHDINSQILTVTITHKSSFTNYHYIKVVEIKKDGEIVSTNTYKNQPDPETFTYEYKIPAAEGATIEVTAICSILGSKTVKLSGNKAQK